MAKPGRSARMKGAAFERKMAKILTDAFEIEFKRGIGQSRKGGQEIPDVYSEQLPWLHIEVKNQKRVSIKKALQQAIDDTEESGKMPIAITRDTGKDTTVTMRLDDWITIMSAYLSK